MADGHHVEIQRNEVRSPVSCSDCTKFDAFSEGNAKIVRYLSQGKQFFCGIANANADAAGLYQCQSHPHGPLDSPCPRSVGGRREVPELFVQVVKLAGEMGLIELGAVAIDCTKLKANASRQPPRDDEL